MTAKTKASNHYVPNRFNDLKWIGNPVTPHKVEQLLRAVMHPAEFFSCGLGNVAADRTQILTEQEELSMVVIGFADEYGWRFHPSTNSWLVRNGIKPNAVLLLLNQLEIEGVPAVVSDNGLLYAVFEGLHRAAHDAVFSTHKVNREYNAYVRKHGIPEHYSTQNRYYNPSELHEVV